MSFNNLIGYAEFSNIFCYEMIPLKENYTDVFGLTPKWTFELWIKCCADIKMVKPKHFLWGLMRLWKHDVGLGELALWSNVDVETFSKYSFEVIKCIATMDEDNDEEDEWLLGFLNIFMSFSPAGKGPLIQQSWLWNIATPSS